MMFLFTLKFGSPALDQQIPRMFSQGKRGYERLGITKEEGQPNGRAEQFDEKSRFVSGRVLRRASRRWK